MNTTTTRRALIQSAPAAAVALAIPASAASGQTGRSAWNAAFADYERAKAEDQAFLPKWRRIRKAYEAEIPGLDTIDWRELNRSQSESVARSLDLDKALQNFIDAKGKTWWANDPEERIARHRAALDSIRAYRDGREACRRKYGVEAADDRCEALGEAFGNARDTLMQMPAPDLAALNWKLQQLRDDDGDMETWTAKYVRQTYEDIARLLPEGR